MTPETKALIEQEAEDTYKATNYMKPLGRLMWHEAYTAGATPYAEKLEAAEQENKRLRECLEELQFSNRQGDPNSYHAIKRILDETLKPKQ